MNKEMFLSEKKKDFIFFLISATVGLISILMPVMLLPEIKHYDSPLFPLVRTGIEGFSLFAICCLIISGIILGFLRPRRPWRWGLATMFLFPVLATIEMIINPYSHNLWPFEFLTYGILTIPGVLGANVGAFIREKLKKNKK